MPAAVPTGEPVRLRATPEDQAVALSWYPSVETPIFALTGYEIQYWPTDNPIAALEVRFPTDAVTGPITFTVRALVNHVGYTFRLRGYNAAGNGPWSARVLTSPHAAQVPGAPALPSVLPLYRQIIVSWLPPVDDGESAILRYELRWRAAWQRGLTYPLQEL